MKSKLRRIAIIGFALMAQALFMVQTSIAGKVPVKMNVNNLKAGINKVVFPSEDLELSGLLFLPEGFNSSNSYPTIIMTTPFNQVKEQSGSVYGKKLAAQGYAAFVFDHKGFGESEGILLHHTSTPPT